MDKKKALDAVAYKIAKCRTCKKGKSGKAVAGEGSPYASVMFIGEAPGRKEAETGRPFIGRSGQLLTKLLNAIGIDRKNVYITSPVKFYPGKRAPTAQEIEHGKMHLSDQIKIIAPKFIVLLGNTAIKALLSASYKVTKWHGKTIHMKDQNYFVTFHPAAALRFPKKVQPSMETDLKLLKDILI